MEIISKDNIVSEYNYRIIDIKIGNFKLINLCECCDLFQDLIQAMVTGTSFNAKYSNFINCTSCDMEYGGNVEVSTIFILKNNFLKIETINTSFTIKCTEQIIEGFFKAFKLLKPSKVILPILDNYTCTYKISTIDFPINLCINNIYYPIYLSNNNDSFIEKISNNENIDISFNYFQDYRYLRFSYKDNIIRISNGPNNSESNVQYLKLTPILFDFLNFLDKFSFKNKI